MQRLRRSFFARDPLAVAPDLLGKVLVHGDRQVRLVEVEAYLGAADPASHAYRGPTRRNATMFGPPGGLYVYFTYGMHWCANVVCGDHDGLAVLLRAGAPVAGVEKMRAARGAAARRDLDLCSGPAKLAQAIGLDGRMDGTDLCAADAAIWIGDDGTAAPAPIVCSGRIGLSKATEHPWRFSVDGDPNVSRTRS